MTLYYIMASNSYKKPNNYELLLSIKKEIDQVKKSLSDMKADITLIKESLPKPPVKQEDTTEISGWWWS